MLFMGEDETQVRAEMQSILAVLEELTGIQSRWSGRMELVLGAKFQGTKQFSCDILINASLTGQDVRWRTMIHEALHSLSAGYVSSDYQELRGWEEGVVEHLQRLYRPTVLARLGITVEENVFFQVEATHLFNVYLDALEDLRRCFTSPQQEFYLRLLRTPLRDRQASLFGLSQGLTVTERTLFVLSLSEANAVLKRKAN